MTAGKAMRIVVTVLATLLVGLVADTASADRGCRHPDPPSGSFPAVFRPVAAHAVAAPYGCRRHPLLNDIRLHLGVDFAAPIGTNVRAAADGRVIKAERSGPYGNLVVLEHADGATSWYAHLSGMAVAVGSPVARGEVIGWIGATGLVAGPLLHFELRIADVPVDPEPHLVDD